MWQLLGQSGRRVHSGASLVEFAIVAPVLVLLMIGGSALLARMHVQSALEAAAEQAAWTAARSGGDEAQVQSAIQRSMPFAAPGEVQVCTTGAGYAQDVMVQLRYRGPLIERLPLFNAPLPDAIAIATGQSERVFQWGDCAAFAAAAP